MSDDISLEPATLDRYVGVYAPSGGEFSLYTITRDGGKLLLHVTAQPTRELAPISETEFVIKPAAVQITFLCEGNTPATALLLRLSGADVRAPRIDEATSEHLKARLAARIEAQQPIPGSEAALRRLIEGIRSGAPDYDEMGPALAQLTRQQLPGLQSVSSYLGAIQSITFQGVGNQGWDVYDVQREHGSSRWRIALASSGKIIGAAVVLTSPMPVNMGP